MYSSQLDHWDTNEQNRRLQKGWPAGPSCKWATGRWRLHSNCSDDFKPSDDNSDPRTTSQATGARGSPQEDGRGRRRWPQNSNSIKKRLFRNCSGGQEAQRGSADPRGVWVLHSSRKFNLRMPRLRGAPRGWKQGRSERGTCFKTELVFLPSLLFYFCDASACPLLATICDPRSTILDGCPPPSPAA